MVENTYRLYIIVYSNALALLPRLHIIENPECSVSFTSLCRYQCSSKDMTLFNPFKSSSLTPFSSSLSLIFIANSRAVRSTPFTLFRGLEYNRNRDDPLKLILAPTDNKYLTTVAMPRAAAITRGYNSLPVLDDKQVPTSPDAADVSYTGAILVVESNPSSALGTFGSAPFSPINSLMHFKMTVSFTYLARTTSTRNVPPVRTRRLMAMG
mmetsp:Transcript_29836/g.63277  ORF Transcript_29836/g.63277 Transcript_29836/m.63277 type:complete len:210 (-) Transcript_29836:615-1244(-)